MRAIPSLSLCLLLLLVLTARLGQAQESPDTLTFDDLFEHDRPGEWPQQIAWSPDGSRLVYLLPGAPGEGQLLESLTPEDGERELLFRTGELVTGDEEPPELDAYNFSPDGGALLLEVADALHLLALPQRTLRPLAQGVENPAFSPDGRQVAFVRDGDLHLMELAGGEERALTEDGREGEVLNGKTDWVYGEEIWGREPEGFWWSPDGRFIAFYHFVEEGVERYPLVNFLPQYPEVEWQRYPKAGEVNPRVQIGVVEVATGEITWLATGHEADGYLARVKWLPDGERLAVQRLDRDQTRLDLLLCDPGTGACSPHLSDESATWVNLSRDLSFLADGRFLWTSEREGWRRLYLYGAGGELLRVLSAEGFAVTSVDGVDEERGRVYYTAFAASGMGAAYRRVFRVNLDGSGHTPLTGERGWHEALVAPGGTRWLHTESTADRPPRRRVMQAGGGEMASLPAGPEPPYDPAVLPAWEFLSIWGPDGARLPARMLRPAGFDPGRRYPVIMYHYGCPSSQVVSDQWGRRGRDLWHKMMAQRGYAILQVDNVTSVFFGKQGEDRVHRSFGAFNLEAQLAGVEYLKSLDWVDPERIGIWGWSGGGSNTLAALFMRPGVWRAGVAGAPVTDWRLYDTIWTERYLDHPEDNPEGYRASSPVTYAAALEDPLLIVHGTADDNVHPQNTLVLSQALIEAGLPFEQAIYPRQKHGFKGKAERHFYQRMTEFFDRHLR